MPWDAWRKAGYARDDHRACLRARTPEVVERVAALVERDRKTGGLASAIDAFTLFADDAAARKTLAGYKLAGACMADATKLILTLRNRQPDWTDYADFAKQGL